MSYQVKGVEKIQIRLYQINNHLKLKKMKRLSVFTLAIVLVLFLLSSFVLKEDEVGKKTIEGTKSITRVAPAGKSLAMKKWEVSPDGKKFKLWEASPEGKKAHASAAKIRKHLTNFTNMEAVVTSLSHPTELGGFGVMVKINNEDYILNFSAVKAETFPWLNIFTWFNSDLAHLQSLKVNDKIIIKSHNAGNSTKYPYLIISGDYVERDGKIIYKRDFSKEGC
jgi:hypothetical protein